MYLFITIKMNENIKQLENNGYSCRHSQFISRFFITHYQHMIFVAIYFVEKGLVALFK